MSFYIFKDFSALKSPAFEGNTGVKGSDSKSSNGILQ